MQRLSKNAKKPTLFEVADDGAAFPTKGPEPNQLTLLLVDAEDVIETGGEDAGLLFGLAAPGPGAVSLQVCHSQARPSSTGRLAGAGGSGG